MTSLTVVASIAPLIPLALILPCDSAEIHINLPRRLNRITHREVDTFGRRRMIRENPKLVPNLFRVDLDLFSKFRCGGSLSLEPSSTPGQ